MKEWEGEVVGCVPGGDTNDCTMLVVVFGRSGRSSILCSESFV